jgi:hypothetical protein
VLAAAGAFINNAGSSAVTATSGRWLIYSSAPGADSFSGLDSGNTATWHATYGTVPPASVTAGGNRYLFAMQPTLTFTSTDATKTYGTDATPAIASHYGVTGYQSGVANAFLGDNAASTFTGGPSITSSGAPATASVAGGPYAINLAQGSLAAISGYAFAFNGSGRLTVNPAPVTVTALSGWSFYGLSPTNPGLTAIGLQNGESIAALTGLFNSFGITNTTKPGSYTIGVGGTLTNPNYILVGTTSGTWSVSPLGGPRNGLPWPSTTIPPVVFPTQTPSDAALGALSSATIDAALRPTVTPGLSPSARPPASNASSANRDTSAKPASRDAGLDPTRPPLTPQLPAPRSPALPGQTLAASPAPLMTSPADPPGASSGGATPAGRGAGSGCGGMAGTITGPASGAPGAAAPAEGCAPTIASRVVDFALKQLNREALAKAIEQEFVETVHAGATPRKVLMVSLAFTSIAFTAGLVGWFLRGGSLVAALLSSIPLWRGFDPLVIVTQSRRSEGRGASGVDTMFDGARAAAAQPRGLPQ